MKFKSLPQLLDFFKDEKDCIKYFEKMRWNGAPQCPHCKAKKPYVTSAGYKCSNNACYKKFTCKVGTIFEGSKISFRTWFAAIYLVTSHKKGISSVQLAVDLNVTQKTAWFMLHRIREMLKAQMPESLEGNNPIEADETHVGGKEENRHKNKKRSEEYPELSNDGKPYNKKKVVLGIVERGGKIILKHVPSTHSSHLVSAIEKHVPKGSDVMTDESTSYFKLKDIYNHNTVNHSMRVYAVGNTHTNTIENFFSIFKRGLLGIYHQVSEKHLNRYLNEFAARYNSRNDNAYDRFEEFLKQAEGGLLYKNLIAKTNGEESKKSS